MRKRFHKTVSSSLDLPFLLRRKKDGSEVRIHPFPLYAINPGSLDTVPADVYARSWSAFEHISLYRGIVSYDVGMTPEHFMRRIGNFACFFLDTPHLDAGSTYYGFANMFDHRQCSYIYIADVRSAPFGKGPFPKRSFGRYRGVGRATIALAVRLHMLLYPDMPDTAIALHVDALNGTLSLYRSYGFVSRERTGQGKYEMDLDRAGAERFLREYLRYNTDHDERSGGTPDGP